MRRRTITALLTLTALCLILPTFAPAAAKPAWTLTATPMPANFAPGSTSQYLLVATNVGAAPTTGEAMTIETTLPAGLEPLNVSGIVHDFTVIDDTPDCSIVAQTVKCESKEVLHQGRWFQAKVNFKVTAPPGPIDTTATVSGGGAQALSVTGHAVVQAEPVPFGFLDFESPLSGEEGEPITAAGSHPYEQTVDFGFPTKEPGTGLTNSGHPRTLHIDLPRGLLGNPAATPVLCTEAELTSIVTPGCPEESQIGTTDTTSLVGGNEGAAILSSNLYNMVPPPGALAEIATDVGNTGVFVHLIISVRSDGDYGIEATVNDILAFGNEPIFNSHAQIWGDPSSPAHERIRGRCIEGAGVCPVEPQETALLSMPTDCAEEPISFGLSADTWEEPSPPNELRRTSYGSASIAGVPQEVTKCDQIKYEPEISVRPTTNLTDSPSGLDVQIHQPQETKLSGLSTGALKDATITFPKGMTVNPSQAWGLAACTEGQIGFLGNDEGQPRFSRDPQSCPGAAKLGTVEVTSPALVRRNAKHEVEVEPGPEGAPILDPVHGSLYLAQPFANPFDSLVTVYVVIEDKAKGLVAKLAGKGELDPQSGQITTRFTESPELPIEDFKAHIFGGARGALITPQTCGGYATKAEMTPWNAPDAAVPLSSSFDSTATPRGGACPTSESQLPNATALSAGTQSPSAGKYSPLLFKLSREDGTQRMGRIEATLPTGLIAKLAGVGTCSEADIAKARSREVPEQGVLEQADPSCPKSSEVGTAEAAVGAGSTPYRTGGHVYLAGPYKGAPISLVAIAPAVAGPFDLGTVVIRSALYLDPTTAQARVVSDPLPTILDGVPTDVRSVVVRSERPNFTLNPTSCDEKSFGGNTLSTLGQPAPLFERFQVGGCKSLPYKPKFTARLKGPIHRGGHPSFRAELTAKPGEANTAAFSVTLPTSEFIDQAHFRTICTRVQYAANQCPAGSIYGHVRAFTPLLDYPLEGPIYLRSSTHKLPDTVAALRGPAYQPIAFDASARIDSVKGGLRARVETVPDAPISKVVISLAGGKKGLFQNSTNICKGVHRMKISFTGQNGKVNDTQPPLKAKCPKGKGKKPKGGGGH